MHRIVLTGGPGAGKTTVLEELRRRGYATGDDAARSIIRERRAAGLSPRPDALTFARQVFEKEVDAYQSKGFSPAFFERGVVEAVGLLLAAGALDEEDARQLLSKYRYQLVFLFPPWEDIYRTDDERDHTFDHAVKVHESTLQLYRRHGYTPIAVPPGTVENRVALILAHLDALEPQTATTPPRST